jgi:LacI family transcriptional regulator
MGDVAMKNLINQLDGQSQGIILPNPNKITLRSELIIRDSSKRKKEQ